MNKNRYWNQNMGGRSRGGFNRGGRGGYRGWPRGRGSFNGPNYNSDGYRGFQFQKPSNPTDFWKQRQNKREAKDTPGIRLTEDLIGVTEYISDHKGFTGIIKSRYSDFQVSEMNEKGEFAKLTNTKPPELPSDETVDEDEDLLLNKYNLEILPMETWDKINSLTMNTGNAGDDDKVEIEVDGLSKEQRTKIHDAVKKAFGESIVGSTVNVGDKKLVRFQKYRKGVRIDNRVKWVWPGEYVYFVVHKQNCDTMEAATRIAERLGMYSVNPSTLGYAGTKDRRAKTSQWFSVKRKDPNKIASLCKNIKDVHIGNYSFSDTHLKLGMLKGNKFRLALRNVTTEAETVDMACQYLKEKGFINYFGLQRFGSRIDTPTYDIGLKMLQGNYREAIEAILEPRVGPLEAALRTYRARGPGAALQRLPRRAGAAHAEARLLRALAAAPNDLVGALGSLARNVRLLYLHSYQSLVWNRAVSERIKRFGLQPVVGDCVPLNNAEIEDIISDGSESEQDGEEDEDNKSEGDEDFPLKKDIELSKEMDENKDGTGKDGGNSAPKVSGDKNEKKRSKKKKETPKPPVPIKILTQEDIDSGKYTMFNIVMPLPGAFVVYPPNMEDFYKETLTKDGLKMNMRQKIKSYNMSGAYRHMVVRPLGVEWRHVQYTDPFADLLASDLDELEGRKITGILEDGKYRALLLTMVLPSSCYATMALRELLKVDTSSNSQALQNNYHKKKDSSKATDKEADTKVEAGNKSEESMDSEADQDTETKSEEQECKSEEQSMEESNNDPGEKRKLEEELDDNVKKIRSE